MPNKVNSAAAMAGDFCPDCFRDKAKVATVQGDVCSKGLPYVDAGALAACQRIADRIKAAALTPSADAAAALEALGHMEEHRILLVWTGTEYVPLHELAKTVCSYIERTALATSSK